MEPAGPRQSGRKMLSVRHAPPPFDFEQQWSGRLHVRLLLHRGCLAQDGSCSLDISLTYLTVLHSMKKSDVNGDNTNEVFKWLKSQKSQLGMERIKCK